MTDGGEFVIDDPDDLLLKKVLIERWTEQMARQREEREKREKADKLKEDAK